MADGATDWTGLIGLLGAAAIGTAGGLYNNYVNKKLQQSINADVINLANTAHQREVADLRAAGLNPILSATGNGAPTPSLGTPHQDNVLSDFGSSARAVGDMLSKQRSLVNRDLSLANDSQAMENEITSQTMEEQINSANSSAEAQHLQSAYEREIADSRFRALSEKKWKYDFDRRAWVLRPEFQKDIADSVQADINRPWREATQSWLSTGGNVARDVISGATGVKNLMRKQPKGIYNRRIDPKGRVSTSWTEYK